LPFDAWWELYRAYYVSKTAWREGRSLTPSKSTDERSISLEKVSSDLIADIETHKSNSSGSGGNSDAPQAPKAEDPSRLLFDDVAGPGILFPRAGKRRSMSKMRPPTLRNMPSLAVTASAEDLGAGARRASDASNEEQPADLPIEPQRGKEHTARGDSRSQSPPATGRHPREVPTSSSSFGPADDEDVSRAYNEAAHPSKEGSPAPTTPSKPAIPKSQSKSKLLGRRVGARPGKFSDLIDDEALSNSPEYRNQPPTTEAHDDRSSWSLSRGENDNGTVSTMLDGDASATVSPEDVPSNESVVVNASVDRESASATAAAAADAARKEVSHQSPRKSDGAKGGTREDCDLGSVNNGSGSSGSSAASRVASRVRKSPTSLRKPSQMTRADSGREIATSNQPRASTRSHVQPPVSPRPQPRAKSPRANASSRGTPSTTSTTSSRNSSSTSNNAQGSPRFRSPRPKSPRATKTSNRGLPPRELPSTVTTAEKAKNRSSGTPLDSPSEPPSELLEKKAPRLGFLDGVEDEVAKATGQNPSQQKRPSISFKDGDEDDETRAP